MTFARISSISIHIMVRACCARYHLKNAESINDYSSVNGMGYMILQVELLDAALQRNTIICLGSSAGNTFISVMLLKEFSSKLRKQLPSGGKRSVVCLSSGT